MRQTIVLAVAALSCVAGEREIHCPDKIVEGFGRLALECVHREYPNKIAHVMGSDADAKPPRQLTPAFFGCYDWHSSVHGHWLLVRAVRLYPDQPFAKDARAALARSLTPAEHRRRSRVPEGRGSDLVRAPIWPRLAAAARGGAAYLGRS